jgi:hypothetical protein
LCLTGSSATAKTIGIVVVADLAANVATIPNATIDIAGVFEALAKSAQTLRHPVRRSGVEESDHRYRRLLRARRERPSDRRCAEQRDEIASFHRLNCIRSPPARAEVAQTSIVKGLPVNNALMAH